MIRRVLKVDLKMHVAPLAPALPAGVGFATRQVGNRTKPNLVVTVDEQGTVCMRTQSTFKTTEIKFKLNEPFDETTADDRKTRVGVGPSSHGLRVWVGGRERQGMVSA